MAKKGYWYTIREHDESEEKFILKYARAVACFILSFFLSFLFFLERERKKLQSELTINIK